MFASFMYIIFVFISGSFLHPFLKPNLKYFQGGYGHMYSRINEVKSTKNVDFLFLGSSHSYRGFDTRIFKKAGYKTFNLGSSAQTPIQTEVLINRYLDNLNPKKVIYEVYPSTFSSDGVESSLDIISNDQNDLYSFQMILKNRHIKTLNTFIYGSIVDMFGLHKNYVEPVIKGEDKYIKGGFVEKKLKYFKVPKEKLKKNKWNLNDQQFESFEIVLQTFKDKNIEVILVVAPFTKYAYNSYTNNDEFNEKMKSYGLKYYNFNDILSLNDSLHFYDASHLNQNGVKIFNEKLISILEQDS